MFSKTEFAGFRGMGYFTGEMELRQNLPEYHSRYARRIITMLAPNELLVQGNISITQKRIFYTQNDQRISPDQIPKHHQTPQEPP